MSGRRPNQTPLLPQGRQSVRTRSRNGQRSKTTRRQKRVRNDVLWYESEVIDRVSEDTLGRGLMVEDVDADEIVDNLNYEDPKFREALDEFVDRADTSVKEWVAAHPHEATDLLASDYLDDEHTVAWNVWAMNEGYGIGFGDVMKDTDHRLLDQWLSRDSLLRDLHSQLEEQMDRIVHVAARTAFPNVFGAPTSPVPTADLTEDLAIINRHRARLGMVPLDWKAQGWEAMDVQAEAERIRRLNPSKKRVRRARHQEANPPTRATTLHRRLLS